MSKVFNAKTLATRQPVARKVIEVNCPDYDGELIFRVQEPDGAAVIRAFHKDEKEGAGAATSSLIADCVIDEKGRPVFDYKAAADFFIANVGKVNELIEAVGELAKVELEGGEDSEEGDDVEDPTSAE